MQKLLTIIIAAMIIYSLAKEHFQDNKIDIHSKNANSEQINTTTEMTGSFLERVISNLLVNVISTKEGQEMVGKIIKPQYPNQTNKIQQPNISVKKNNIVTSEQLFNIETRGAAEEGKGPAICGHSVRAKYKIYRAEDNIIAEEGIKIFTLGSRETLLGLENVIVGMYIGQSRHGLIPAGFSQTKTPSPNKKVNVAYKVDVTLLDIIPRTFIRQGEIRIFDDTTSNTNPYLCGSSARFNLKISKLNGEVVYNSENMKNNSINMLIGDMNYPIVISYALCNRMVEGIHTALTPGKYFRAFGNKNSNKIFPKEQLPDEEFFIMEISSK